MFRKIFGLSSLVILLFIASTFIAVTRSGDDKKASSKKGSYVQVFYFHGDHRCETCLTIEAYTKEAVNDFFENELKSGKVKFDLINYDSKKNESYMDKYQLFNQALIIAKYKNGQQVEWKSLEKIWEYVRDHDKFLKYVKKQVKDYLKDA